jgi:xylulokinase
MNATRMLGLDVGTSGCKAIVFDSRWNIIARSFRRYDLIHVGENGYELEAETVWGKLREAIAEAHGLAGGKTDAVAVSALGDVIIPLDAAGTAIRPCILDFDPRGKDEIRDFVQGFGAAKLFETTGMPPLHINSLAKILWIRKNEPHTFRQVRRWATFEDYILQKLGGKTAVSYSMAARTMLFDMHRKTWSTDILAAAGVHERALPQPVPSGEVVAHLTDGAAGELGFSAGAAICSGGHDMVCAAIGAGLDANDRRTALNIMGTMEAVIVLTKTPNLEKEMLRNLYPCYPAWNEYLSLSLNLTSGSVLDWYRNLVPGVRGQGDDGDEYHELLKDIDSGKPGELLVGPHFSGVCNPVFNPDARGFLYGLSLNTAFRDLAQGILEGLCYDLKSHVEGFRKAGIPIEKLKVVGGGAHSDAWLQLKANIAGLEISRSDILEASAMGAAALCGKAVGLIDDPYKASGLMGLRETRFLPEPEAARRFEEKFVRYLSLRERIGVFETC